jgi:hypothetical protein
MVKKLKLKVPKRIAGVKLPRVLRKGPVADFLNSSAGQLLLAEALVALGGALAAERVGSDSGSAESGHNPIQGLKKAGRFASAKGAGAADDVARESRRLSFAFNEAIRAFRTGLERHLPDGQETTQDVDTVAAGDAPSESTRAKKKPSGSPTETPSMPH